jgi:hypothetical protein
MFVACSNDGPQTTHADNSGPSEQDSANRVGTAHEAKGLQGSGGNGGIAPPKLSEVVARRSRSKESMAQQSARRGQKPDHYNVHKARGLDLDLPYELPYRPAAHPA